MSTEGTEIYDGLLRDNEALRADLAASEAREADQRREVKRLLAEQDVWTLEIKGLRDEIMELRRKELLAR